MIFALIKFELFGNIIGDTAESAAGPVTMHCFGPLCALRHRGEIRNKHTKKKFWSSSSKSLSSLELCTPALLCCWLEHRYRIAPAIPNIRAFLILYWRADPSFKKNKKTWRIHDNNWKQSGEDSGKGKSQFPSFGGCCGTAPGHVNSCVAFFSWLLYPDVNSPKRRPPGREALGSPPPTPTAWPSPQTGTDGSPAHIKDAGQTFLLYSTTHMSIWSQDSCFFFPLHSIMNSKTEYPWISKVRLSESLGMLRAACGFSSVHTDGIFT